MSGTTTFIADAQFLGIIFDNIAGTICIAMLDLQQQFRIPQTYFLAGSAGAALLQRPLALHQSVEQ